MKKQKLTEEKNNSGRVASYADVPGISKTDALKIIDEVFERYFTDKGADELFLDMMEDLKYAEFDEEDNIIKEPPGMQDIYLAAGFTKEEIIKTLKWNPNMFEERKAHSA